MTDNQQEQTATEKKLADDYKKDFTKKPGYSYRTKVVKGETVVTVKKIGK
jgi:hypothetical protein